MTENLVTLGTEGIEPRASDPAERRLDGDPRFTIWGVESAGGGSLVSGIWEVTPGKWRSIYKGKWEFCTLVSGQLTITQDGCAPVTYRSGDSFILRDGFEGTWEAPVTTRKHYVVHFPART